MERINVNGRYVSHDGGATWLLVEPSAQWEASRGSAEADPPPVTLEAVQDRLAEVVATVAAVAEQVQALAQQ